MNTDTYYLYFDGLCEPANPGGIACWGWVLLLSGKVVDQGGGVETRGAGATNNVAEWAALEHGLKAAAMRHPGVLEIRGDSQLVINQLHGTWQVRAPHLAEYFLRCRKSLQQMGCPWRAMWIPREENTLADALSWDAYRSASVTKEGA